MKPPADGPLADGAEKTKTHPPKLPVPGAFDERPRNLVAHFRAPSKRILRLSFPQQARDGDFHLGADGRRLFQLYQHASLRYIAGYAAMGAKIGADVNRHRQRQIEAKAGI